MATTPAAEDAADDAARAIERAQNMSSEDFVDQLIRPRQDSGWPDWTHPRTGRRYGLRVRRAVDLSDAELEACFELVQATSGDDYRASADGWRPVAKRTEMRTDGLRYVLVVEPPVPKRAGAGNEGDGAGGERVAAFTSMMPTFEGGEPVVYCYEIHLEPALQGSGLGSLLMGLVARVAASLAPARKTMLTCFTANARARRFYEALGYGVDDLSPRGRRLRGGRTVQPDYVILSRPTATGD